MLRINLDSTRKKATGVTYVDAAGTEFEQPADLVLRNAATGAVESAMKNGEWVK